MEILRFTAVISFRKVAFCMLLIIKSRACISSTLVKWGYSTFSWGVRVLLINRKQQASTRIKRGKEENLLQVLSISDELTSPTAKCDLFSGKSVQMGEARGVHLIDKYGRTTTGIIQRVHGERCLVIGSQQGFDLLVQGAIAQFWSILANLICYEYREVATTQASQCKTIIEPV